MHPLMKYVDKVLTLLGKGSFQRVFTFSTNTGQIHRSRRNGRKNRC